jgi:diaminopimelate decarboxylase
MRTVIRNGCLSVRNGHLFVEEVDCVELIERFGSPLFVVSEAQLRRNIRRFQQTFARHWPEGRIVVMPSIKASPIIALQHILNSEGAGCDVFGPGELEIALRAEVPPEMISVNGSIKDRDLIRTAIAHETRIVLDSPREMELCEAVAAELGKTAKVLFRLKPYLANLDDMSDYAPDYDIRFMTQIIKYGIPKSELLAMAKAVGQCHHLDPIGIHVHMGRHSKRARVWQAWTAATVALTAELAAVLGGGWQPQVINLGGGFPSGPDDDTDVTIKGYAGPPLDELAEVITSTLRQGLAENGLRAEGLRLEFEPGRAIHCDTGLHLTTVRNIKREQDNLEYAWIEIDTSQCFLGVGGANFAAPKFDLVCASGVDRPASGQADVVGMTCNLEILYYQVPLPEVSVGDVFALLNTGSYIETCAQNFNALPRPAVALVNGGQCDLIKRAETIDDVLACNMLPERFAAQSVPQSQRAAT